jgi:iron complex outermembrane recepter protein
VSLQQVYGVGYATKPAAAELARSAFWDSPDASQLNLDNQLEYRFNTGPVSQVALAGIDAKQYTIDDYGAFAAAPSLSLLDPIYTMTSLPPGTAFQSYHFTQKTGGVYAQDQIKWDRFLLTLSRRYDLVRSDHRSRRERPPEGGRDRARRCRP